MTFFMIDLINFLSMRYLGGAPILINQILFMAYDMIIIFSFNKILNIDYFIGY
jgi:hypothetical protein